LTRHHGRFTENKQVVRDIQGDMIATCFKGNLGNLRYFGLCSPEMKDVKDWAPLFSLIVAAERGGPSEEYHDQHHLLLTAAREKLWGRLRLLRGDIDRIILNGEDEFANRVPYPFDVISLDYSGGLFYKQGGQFVRLGAIERLIHEQAQHKRPYLLLVSANCHAIDAGEVKHSIENLKTQLNREKWNGDEVCDAILKHPKDIVRLWFYLPNLVRMVAANERCQSESENVISYPGNNGVEMLNFRFHIRPDDRAFAPRFPRERLTQVLNAPIVRIENGLMKKASLGLPKLRVIGS
jgi:hypothetical protein